MSDIVRIEKVNEVYLKVVADPAIKKELAEYFTFMIANYKFSPAYKFGSWDGKIRLMNVNTGALYYGLLPKLLDLCEKLGYKVHLDEGFNTGNELPVETIDRILKKFPSDLYPRDYQQSAVEHCLTSHRALILCPTASGKSFIIYLMFRYYQALKKKVLLIVPLAGLVKQMSKDFTNYNQGNFIDIHEVTAGVDKNVKADIYMTTWQSIQKLPQEWYDRFDVIIGDEAHLFKAKVLTSIMEKCVNIKYKFGFTGSLDDSVTNAMVLTGLFGPVHRVITTKELQDNGTLSTLAIHAVILSYSDKARKENKKKTYQEEIHFIVTNHNRNIMLKKLVENLSGNVLLLFQFVDKHGKVLYDIMKDSTKKKVHLIHGGIKLEERESIRNSVENSDNNCIIASSATFATGTNIVNLHHLVMGSPSKSRIRNIQSIGRVLRKGGDKYKAGLYDIVDDLSTKSYENYAIKHFKERAKIYDDEGFKYTMHKLDIKDE